MDSAPLNYDVIIVGGALAGAATALQLLREQPKLRLLIIEKSAKFPRKVGEASVELSGYFLGRELGLTQHLNEAHLVKQGMRFWFYNQHSETLEDCSEIGGRYLSRIPAYQIDRAVLDEEVLGRAVAAGVELWRPATVNRITLQSGGNQTVEVRVGDEQKCVSARWVVDASGVQALLARQEGWWQPNPDHPTATVWARWTGVKDWDGLDLATRYPDWAMACHGIRHTATNHFAGDGWWAWCIPLKGGDVSIGVVFDQRLVNWPEEGTLGERLKGFLMQHPVAREIMSDAQPRDGDLHWRRNLPYVSSTFVGDGFALVGDAAGFLDPFYSPGMDWIAFTTHCAAQLILAQQHGEPMGSHVANHNRDFALSYKCWFEALYRNKYEYLGDYEFMRLAFLLDLGLYYLGVASQPFKLGSKAFAIPMFSMPAAKPFYHFMALYNRRLAAMARERRNRGLWGRHNSGERFMFKGYTFSQSSALPILTAFLGWMWLELTEGWRSWFGATSRTDGIEKAAAKPANAAAGLL